MGLKHSVGTVIVLLAFASGARATEATIIVADAGRTVQSRFISLAPNRQGLNGVRIVAPGTKSARTTNHAGFMDLDRHRMQRVHVQRPASPPISMAAPRTMPQDLHSSRAQDDAVLELFGASAAPEQPAKFGRTQHSWPLPASVTQKFTSGFGARRDPFHGRDSFHGGIDIAAAIGTPVLASADGVVTKVENGSRYGKYVSVKHRDGSESSYGHLSAQNVRVGQNVRQGQKVGELGNTGRSTGAHLDYRLKKSGELVNPMTVLRQPSATTQRVASTRSVTSANGVRIIR